MTPLEILKAARSKIAVARHWTKGQFARTRQGGRARLPTEPDAKCYCAVGAILAAAELPQFPSPYNPTAAGQGVRDATLLLDRAIYGDDYFYGLRGYQLQDTATKYNDRDDVTHADILATFDRAIKIGEGAVQ
jgi:hypothetical protein